MERTYNNLLPFVLLLLQWDSCFGQAMFDPSFQMQDPAFAAEFRPMRSFPRNQQFRTFNRNFVNPQSPLLHTTSVEPKVAPVDSETRPNSKNYNISELVRSFSDISEDKEETAEERSSARDYGYSAYGPPRPYGYNYAPRPNYGPPTSYASPPPPPPPQYHESYASPPSYHESYAPPPPVHHHTDSKISLLKPLDILKPVTTKVASKVSGLIGLVLALLTGSTPDDLELKGFKDIVINGIVKPLMLAKGGIKSLISKLAIPVISLLLINLEVLITIWWLWEDCKEPVYAPPPSYHKPSYNYNSY